MLRAILKFVILRRAVFFSVMMFMSSVTSLKFRELSGNIGKFSDMQETAMEKEMASIEKPEETSVVSLEMKKLAGAFLRGEVENSQRVFMKLSQEEQTALQHATSDVNALFGKAREWAKKPLTLNYEHGADWESKMRDFGEKYLLTKRHIELPEQRRWILDRSYTEEDKLLQLLFQDSLDVKPRNHSQKDFTPVPKYPVAIALRNAFEEYGYEFQPAGDSALMRVNSPLTDAKQWGLFDSRRTQSLW
jgi:hypothetical protein